MAEIIKGGYNDRGCEGNSSKYHTGETCIEPGCDNPAGTAWSPHWCVECNIKRIDRITRQMEEIVDRTVRQQLEDLDLKIIRQKKQVTGVTWARKGAHRMGTMVRPPHMRIADRCITFNTASRKLLKNFEPKFAFGVGTYEGKKVILLKEDPGGYKISPNRAGDGRFYGGKTGAGGLLAWLRDRKVRNGCYELVEINGGWMGVPEE